VRHDRGVPLIVTGFEPFEGRRRNRSWQAVERMTLTAERVCLPVEYARLAEMVPALAARADTALLLVGEASRRAISIERVAKSACDPARADNAGAYGAALAGPAELHATWDADRALAAARAFAPAELSDDAGGFCCNAALYHALRAAPPGLRVGFVHVPRARWPFGPRLASLARALSAIAEALRGE
jgi:pyroglutamyl-peptidase